MSTTNLARISSGRRVIDRAAGGKEIALFQDAQDAIDYVQMIETRDRLRDGIKALIERMDASLAEGGDDDDPHWYVGYDTATTGWLTRLRALLDPKE